MQDRNSWSAYALKEGLIRDDPDPAPGGNKYHAIAIHVDGRRFASKKEAARYLELRLLEKGRAIADLTCQPRFPLLVLELWRSQVPIVVTQAGVYTADFQYTDLTTGEIVVEDVKGEATKTTDYRLRKRIAELVHGVSIREV